MFSIGGFPEDQEDFQKTVCTLSYLQSPRAAGDYITPPYGDDYNNPCIWRRFHLTTREKMSRSNLSFHFDHPTRCFCFWLYLSCDTDSACGCVIVCGCVCQCVNEWESLIVKLISGDRGDPGSIESWEGQNYHLVFSSRANRQVCKAGRQNIAQPWLVLGDLNSLERKREYQIE